MAIENNAVMNTGIQIIKKKKLEKQVEYKKAFKKCFGKQSW